MKVGIIGAGYVGESTGRLMNDLNNEIYFYDIIKKEFGDKFNFVNSLKELVNVSEIIFICVPTPQSENGKIDLDILHSTIEKIISIYKEKNILVPLVIKSTVVPGTTQSIIKKFKDHGMDVSVGNNPEFITEISNSWSDDESMNRDWSSEDKIVIGHEDDNIKNILTKLYYSLSEKIIFTDTKTSELIKYASNYCLASKISFFNELFEMSKNLGTDNEVLVKALSVDPRIGKYGTVNGKAYGGKCLPKDTKALQYFFKNNLETPMLNSTIKINKEMGEKYGIRE